MAKQALRQDARRRVAEALAAKQKERLEREKRHAELAVEVLTAIAERDETIARTEKAAGDAIRTLLGERLNVPEIAALCGGQLHVKELQSLSRRSAGTGKPTRASAER